MKGVHLDKRLSPILPDGRRIVPSFTTYLEAGCGFGGSCFPKDVNALTSHGSDSGVPMQVLEAVMRVNARQPPEIMRLLRRRLASVEGSSFAVLGLSFKPGPDDSREAPADPVIHALHSRGARSTTYDPVQRPEAERQF